jgi:DMSO/TMAO reductase YedYZ molybdopterin-dependent catalytic subunit
VKLPEAIPKVDESSFTGRFRDERVAARIGVALGTAILICFLTGLISHLIQHPPGWFIWPTRPVGLYRFTQGLHVLSGIAAIPLLIAKLYAVYPKLFATPPVRSLVHAIERGTVFVLVGAVFFEIVTGLLNIAHWYPWNFFFPTAHYALAYIAIGSVVLHIAVKLPIIRRALLAPLDEAPDEGDPNKPVEPAGGPSRRAFLWAAGAGVGAVVLATAGATVPWLRRVSALAVRTGEGPQGVPINKTAGSAGVVEAATSPNYRLTLAGPAGEVEFALDELQAMKQHTASLPIACVEGWSANGEWTGVRIADLVAQAGGSDDEDVRFVSLQQGGIYSQSVLPARHARDSLTLLALRLNGEPLDIDHGFPCRLIAPSRPGVLQTKWIQRVEVVS